jgi:nuclear pore complex protein Nup205
VAIGSWGLLATIPTVGDAIDALTELYNDLSNVLHKISDLSAELTSKEHLRVDNILEASKRSLRESCFH